MSTNMNELVDLAKSGDTNALSELVYLYHTPAIRVAQTILKNPENAEDAVQDAWILALRKLDSLRTTSSFGGWFYRIVSNIALRKRQTESVGHLDLALWENTLQPECEKFWLNTCIDLLPLAMTALSERDYIVTSLHYFSRVPLAMIAHLLDIPQGTVKSRLHHARQVLRKEILTMTNQSNKRPDHIPTDFRETIAGMQGEIPWQKIFSSDFTGWSANRQPIPAGTTPSYWTVIGEDGLVGEEYEHGTFLTYGDPGWTDIELSLLITPLGGGNAQVFFRDNHETNSTYVLDMYMGWQAIGIRCLTDNGDGQRAETKLSVVNYPLEHGREYAVDIAARGQSITTYVDGALVNQVTDDGIANGQITLNIWQAKTLYRDIRVRTLS